MMTASMLSSREHVVISEVYAFCVIEGAKALRQRLVGITHRAQRNVASLLRRFQVSELRDRSTSQYSDAKKILFFHQIRHSSQAIIAGTA